MFVYGISLATPGNSATNGTPNTESNTWSMKAGIRNVALQAMYATGKGAGLTAISGIIHRIISFVTASTGGTGITPTPRDGGAQAAKATVISGQTAGTGARTSHLAFGCGAAGPGGWVAPNPDSLPVAQGSGIASVDAVNASGTASLNFEWSAEIVE